MRVLPLAALVLCLLTSACRGPERGLPPTYQALAVPEDRLRSSEARTRGQALYAEHCALCHGIHADGQGIRREGLSTRPRDFTSATWRRQETPRTVYFAIREGVSGTAMPSWKSLDESETWDLVAFLLSLAEPRAGTKQGRCRDAGPQNLHGWAPKCFQKTALQHGANPAEGAEGTVSFCPVTRGA